MNGWSHSYWRDIGWAEFWASVDEATLPAPEGERKPDPVAALEDEIAALTGLPV